MNRVKQVITQAAAAAVMLSLVGCVSWAEHDAVQVSIPSAHQPTEYVNNRDDPVQVVQFARTLSRRGRNAEAAEIYLDAANRFQSVGGRFELDCRKAAVREFWLAGENVQARALLDELEQEEDIYRRAAEQAELQKLREMINYDVVADQS